MLGTHVVFKGITILSAVVAPPNFKSLASRLTRLVGVWTRLRFGSLSFTVPKLPPKALGPVGAGQVVIEPETKATGV